MVQPPPHLPPTHTHIQQGPNLSFELLAFQPPGPCLLRARHPQLTSRYWFYPRLPSRSQGWVLGNSYEHQKDNQISINPVLLSQTIDSFSPAVCTPRVICLKQRGREKEETDWLSQEWASPELPGLLPHSFLLRHKGQEAQGMPANAEEWVNEWMFKGSYRNCHIIYTDKVCISNSS